MQGTQRVRLTYHLILTTKYRHPCITQEMYDLLHKDTLRLFETWGIVLVEMNYEPDHVHILMSAPPTVCLSNIINSYKSVTSRHIRGEFSTYLSQYYWRPYFWSNSYMLLTSGGASIETIKQYIQRQKGGEPLTPTEP